MKLRHNNQVKIKAWLNEDVIAHEDWTVFSEDTDDTIYIFVKDPNGTSQLKLKIEKSPIIEESPSNN